MRPHRFLIATLLAGSVVVPPALAAQITRADSAGVVYETAQRIAAEGRGELAAALYRYIVRQYPGTPAAEESTRRLEALARRGTETSGRGELMVWSTIYGAWLGVAVPAALGADNPEPYGIGLLLGAPVGFLAARSYGRSTALSSGQARVIAFGSQWGTWQGLGWRAVLDIGARTETFCYGAGGGPPCDSYQTTPDEAPWAAMVIGGLTGLGAGALLASGREIPGGAATFAVHGAYWGTWYGLAGAIIVDAHDDAALTWVLAGGNVGLLAGSLAGPRDISSARVWLITAGGIAGVAAGFGLDLLIQPEDEAAAFAIPAATSALGLILGTMWTRSYDAERRRDSGLNDDSALLNLRDGRVALGVPRVAPALVAGAEVVVRLPVFEWRH